MLAPEIHTAEEMHEEWFPHAPFEVVEEFWDSLRIVAGVAGASFEDWQRHGRAYQELQRFTVPTIDID